MGTTHAYSTGHLQTEIIMRWSKLRSQVESFFANSVKGRVRLHSTRYRRMHDQEGRAWITIDGEEIIHMPHIFKWLHERSKRAAELADVENEFGNWQEMATIWKVAEQQLQEESIFCQGELGDAMFRYLQMPISDILGSEEPLIRAIGMLDRRVGKRKLSSLLSVVEHPLVRLLYLFRCEAEGIGSAIVLKFSKGPAGR